MSPVWRRAVPPETRPEVHPVQAPGKPRIEGLTKQALEAGRNRLVLVGALVLLAFFTIGLRLVDVTLFSRGSEPTLATAAAPRPLRLERADIIDRNGALLATSLATASLYAHPRQILDAAQAARKLVRVLPELSQAEVRTRLASPRAFVWLRRNLTPRQQYKVNRLGIPGLYFRRAERRVYPNGRLAAHVLGFTDIDEHGLAGIERSFDRVLRSGGRPLQLSLDLRVQYILRQELASAVAEYRAIGAVGVILDATNGEVVAMTSLPDFDPNEPGRATKNARFNRATLGLYEMGSTFKIFTTAMALEAGTVTMDGGYDATKPIRIARFTIRDYKPKRRWLSVPEIFVYSSNIGAAKMALDVGSAGQRAFLGRLGLLRPARIELPEVGTPLLPSPWREINTMTIAFGHGLAVSPVQMAAAVATVVNGGVAYPPTLLRHSKGTPPRGTRVLSERTSDQMRRLMRLNVVEGTGKRAAAPGYLVGGKTGTAEKSRHGGYARKALISSFAAAFPMNRPRYVILIMLDEPKGTKETWGYATGGWVAAPAVARVVARMAPLMEIEPIDETAPEIRKAMMIDINPRGRTLASF